jgi:hypothetical protein
MPENERPETIRPAMFPGVGFKTGEPAASQRRDFPVTRRLPSPVHRFCNMPSFESHPFAMAQICLFCLILFSLAPRGFAGDKSAVPSHTERGFTPLMDGETFEGWKQEGNWIIEERAFVRARPGGPLIYQKQPVPDDFELRFEWKVSKGCNSGVYYRPGQVEYQVLDDENSPYGENPRQSAASLFFCMAPSRRAARTYGDWNSARILCKGTVIEHWLNDERVLSFDYADPRWAREIELLRIRGGDLTARGGNFWLQDHGQEVAFRNLRLRTIPAEERLIPDPHFQPLPVEGLALEKEQARVRGMIEKMNSQMPATAPKN